MALIIYEDNEKLLQKQIQLPDELSKKLRQNMNLYSKLKNVNGYKRLKALTDDSYNKRSDGKDKIHNNKLSVSYTDAKRIVSDMEHMPQGPNNLEYNMIGGADTLTALKGALGQVRSSVKAVSKVPEVPKLEKSKPTVDKPKDNVKVGNVQVHLENKKKKGIILSENQILILKKYLKNKNNN